MANKKNETALVAQEQGFSKLANVDMAHMMAEELDGLDASFERIKIPSAGSTVYEVPGEDPSESEAVKEFSAVIIYHHPLMAYYKEKYTGGNNPPDCGSFDGVTGAFTFDATHTPIKPVLVVNLVDGVQTDAVAVTPKLD